MNKNIDYLKERFKDCFDVKFRELSTILGMGQWYLLMIYVIVNG